MLEVESNILLNTLKGYRWFVFDTNYNNEKTIKCVNIKLGKTFTPYSN